jgi:hypothetical protein
MESHIFGGAQFRVPGGCRDLLVSSSQHRIQQKSIIIFATHQHLNATPI